MIEEQQSKHPVKLLFFSGLGADSNLFASQKLNYPGLIAPDWIDPKPGESMDDYILRLVEDVDFSKDLVVGGASFGGLVAQRAAVILGVKHCILFGSIKQASEMPKRILLFKPLRHLAFIWVIRFWQGFISCFIRLMSKILSRAAKSVLTQFVQSSPRVIKWSIGQLYSFFEIKPGEDSNDRELSVSPEVFIHQIHGIHDKVFPYKLLQERTDTEIHLLENAGHLLTLYDAKSVNRVIDHVIAESER